MFPVPLSTSRRSLDVAAAATLDRRRDLEVKVQNILERYHRVKDTLDTIMNKSSSVLRLGVEPLLARPQLNVYHMQLTNTTHFLEDLDFFCCKYIEETWPDNPEDTQELQVAVTPRHAIEGRQEMEALWQSFDGREPASHSAEPPDGQASSPALQTSWSRANQQGSSREHVDNPVQGSGNLRQDTPPNLLDTLSEPAACTSPLVPLNGKKKKKDNGMLIDFSSDGSLNKMPDRPSPRSNTHGQNVNSPQSGTSATQIWQASQASSFAPATQSVSTAQETAQPPISAPPGIPSLGQSTFNVQTTRSQSNVSFVPPSQPPVARQLPIGDARRESDLEEIVQDLSDITLTEDEAGPLTLSQSMLELDHSYSCIVSQITSPSSFYVMTVSYNVLEDLTHAMSEYYSKRRVDVRKIIDRLDYCAVFENTEWFRCMIFEKQEDTVEVFFIDYGSIDQGVSLDCVQPLPARFSVEPPYARLCHLVGVEPPAEGWPEEANNLLLELHCCGTVTIIVDDNSSESLGVRLQLPTGEFLHTVLLERGLGVSGNAPASPPPAVSRSPGAATGGVLRSAAEEAAGDAEDAWNIAGGPEYTDALEAVQGYSNRDEADICKHYRGPPETTCFKGTNCKKRHVLMHPDGWTLDRQEVATYPEPLALPAEGCSVPAEVAHVDSCRTFYVHLLDTADEKNVKARRTGGMYPGTLQQLLESMNCPSALASLEPLRTTPALGELVAALYTDGRWYRAQTIETDVEKSLILVRYMDFGNRCWVAATVLRSLPAHFLALPFQAVPCQLADVTVRRGAQVAATRALRELVDQKKFTARVVSVLSCDSLLVELHDRGFSVAETLVAQHPGCFAWQPSPRPAEAAPAAPVRVPG